MKKSLFLLLAVVAVFGLAVSCGGGGDDEEEYNFGGTWAWSGIVTASNLPTMPVGARQADVMTIVQSGNAVTVTFPTFNGTAIIMTGSCDPNARTFAATGLTTGRVPGVRITLQGVGENENSMVGNYSEQLGNLAYAGTWSAGLTSRAAAFSGPPGGAGLLQSVGEFAP